MVKLLVGALLALTAANSMAGNLYIYKDKDGKVLATNVDTSSNFDKFTKKVNVTYYKDDVPSSSSNTAKKAKTYTASEVSKKIGKRPSTSEVVARPSAKKYVYPTNQTSSKDTYIKTDNNIQTSIPTDNIAKYYKPLNWSQSQMQDFKYRKISEKADVIRSDNFEETYKSMLANSYILLGVSRFFDRELPDSSFLSQADKLGAKSVVVHSIGSSSVSYSMNDYKNEAEMIDPNSLPYVYHYSAGFYVKYNASKNPNMLGVFLNEIPLDKRNKYQRNTGAYLVSVIKGSKAYIANIIPEDVVIAINGKSVITEEDFSKIQDSELKTSKNLVFTIIRLINNEPREIQIPINFN
jgi:hypothetical protein